MKKTIYEFIKGLTQANLETRFIVDIYVLKTMIYYLNQVSLRNSCINYQFLLFIMSLCLLVYNLGQRELRKTLLWSNSKVRNQLGKLTNTPTLRWIFQCFQVVHFLRINQWPKVVNLTEERSLILEFLPSSCQKYYLWF